MAKLESLEDVESALAALSASEICTLRGWSFAQALAHCAQSIEYSISGYPALRSAIFRATVGPLVKRKFLSQGRMSHDLEAPIAGAPPVESNTPQAEAVKRLRRAIAAFRAHPGPMAQHLAYGKCTKDEYARLHAMHIADHLAKFPL